jgi:hypothetical protein
MSSQHFNRTSKGHGEITGGRKTLKGKLRTVLFLIDPGKDAAAIRQQVEFIGGPPDALEQLVAQGYIEEIGGAGAGAATGPSTTSTAAVDSELANFRVAKAFMNDTIVDALGIRAFGFTLRLERCATRADLAALLSDYAEALLKKLDRPAAQALVLRTRELLASGRR